jgi:hypothetical protein
MRIWIENPVFEITGKVEAFHEGNEGKYRFTWHKTIEVFRADDHHRVMAAQGDTLWPVVTGGSHDLTEMGLGILQSPALLTQPP